MKYIDVDYYYVKEQVQRGRITLIHCPTEKMTADILTKALGKTLHDRHCLGLGMKMK